MRCTEGARQERQEAEYVSEKNNGMDPDSNAGFPARSVRKSAGIPFRNCGGEAGQESNILVAYFSWADNAVLEEDVDAVASPSVIPPGNVQQLAGRVQEETGGDLFSIRVTDPYPSDWNDCLARANEERGANVRPELVENVENLGQYDTVFLGYPIWWYTAPAIIRSFLESYDFTGKTIILFATSGGSGLGKTAGELAGICPGAKIVEGRLLNGNLSEAALKQWAESV